MLDINNVLSQQTYRHIELLLLYRTGSDISDTKFAAYPSTSSSRYSCY